LILIVEDDKRLSYINSYALKSEGYKVHAAFTLAEARESLEQTKYDVILLDVMLPDGSGIDFCQKIRGDTAAYIIFLTSMTETSGEMDGLVAGGDDYLKKPYSIELLCERVKKALRRKQEIPEFITAGSLTLDTIALQAFIEGKDLLLSHKEFALLLLFSKNTEKIMSAAYLYEKVWGHPMYGSDGAIKNMIYKLRKKLEDYGYDISYDRENGGYYFER
jgi:DNA-binding response OmpR family regulator